MFHWEYGGGYCTSAYVFVCVCANGSAKSTTHIVTNTHTRISQKKNFKFK